MIGWLRGRIVSRDPSGSLVIDVHGVGYVVHVASGDAMRVGEEAELYVYTQVRADAIVLYGFLSPEDRDFFCALLVTPGVGPSTALAAVRTMPTTELRAAIENGDVKLVATIPGVGAKTASRIVLELKGKLVEPVTSVSSRGSARRDDIDDALRTLGYSSSEIRDALEGVSLPEDEAGALRTALHHLRRQ